MVYYISILILLFVMLDFFYQNIVEKFEDTLRFYCEMQWLQKGWRNAMLSG